MLDLHAGVHLNEIELAVFVEKFEGARTPVIDLLASGHATLADLLDQFARDAWRRGFFDHFLVTPLHGAVALAQIDRVAVLVGHDLDFNMAWVLQKLFQVHRRIAKCGTRFGLGHLHGVDERRLGVHHAHAATAATACSLDDDRVTHGFGDTANLHRVIGQFTFRAGYTRHAGADHGLLGRDLIAHDADRLWRRSNELETAFFNPFGKVCVLAQKAITGVNGFGIGHLGRRNDGRHVEVAQS